MASRKLDDKSCVTFLLCDPGLYVHKQPDVQNKWEYNTHTHTHLLGILFLFLTSSTIAGGRWCNIFVPVLGRNGMKIGPTGDIFDQPPR